MERVYAGEFERGLFEIRAFKGDNTLEKSLLCFELSSGVKAGDNSADLEDGIGACIKSPSFYIDDDGQIAAEATFHHCCRGRR